MKHRNAFFAAVLAALPVCSGVLSAQEPLQPLAALDAAMVTLAGQISPKLSGTVQVETFYWDEAESPLGRYWRENLTGELSNVEGRTYTLLDPRSTLRPDYVLGGTVTEIGGVLRVYTRLLSNTGGAHGSILAVWHTDITGAEITAFIDEFRGAGSSRSGSQVRRDQYEPDSRTSPLAITIGAPPVSRTIHSGDEDWFVVVSAQTQQLNAETGGDTDTLIELYDGAAGGKLQENDDGGSNLNARLRWTAEAGKEYLIKIRGVYGDTGSYHFQVEPFGAAGGSVHTARETALPLALADGSASANAVFSNYDDIHYYRLEIPAEGGAMTVYTEGRTDTVLTLEDASGRVLSEDDDSGYDYNARISGVRVSGGTLYIMAATYDDGGPYTLRAELSGSR
ncbi:MAG: hypothetical protein LBD08_03230 [Treponema sp.]|jgi:hypothetical protein|nr:hypothetical protein [Treponema sp.]